MPRKLKLEEVVNMEEGEVVPAVSGIVESVFNQRRGEKDGEPWAFQDLVIKDGALKLKVSVSGRDEIPKTVRGKLLTFISSNGKRGMQGVKVILNTYNGETTKQLRVTPTAEIVEGAGQWENQPAASAAPRRSPASQEELERQKAATSTGRQSANKPLSREFDNEGGDDGDTGPQDPPPQQQAPPPASPRRESFEPGPWHGAPEDWKKFDSRMLKLYRMIQRTLLATHSMEAWAEQLGIEIAPQHFQTIQAQFLVGAERMGLIELVPNVDPADKAKA